MMDLEKMRRLDEEMRKRFGVRWAPPAPVDPEDADPVAAAAARRAAARPADGGNPPGTHHGVEAAGAGGKAQGKKAGTPGAEAAGAAGAPGLIRTKPNRRENEFMLNMMILRNALVAMGPALKDRARRAGKTTWRDLRLMTVLCEKVQEALIATMPERRDDYYTSYARHGHYELVMNGPIRNPRVVLISDKYLGAVCEAAMQSECLVCMREGSEIGGCLIRQALLEVAPPTEVQDGRWRKCEYREAAGSLIRDEELHI